MLRSPVEFAVRPKVFFTIHGAAQGLLLLLRKLGELNCVQCKYICRGAAGQSGFWARIGRRAI